MSVDLLTEELGDYVTVLLVLCDILHDLLRSSQLAQTIALCEEVNQVAEERSRPCLTHTVLLHALVHQLLVGKLRREDELVREANDHQTAPCAVIRGVDLRLLVTRQIEASLELEVNHLLRTSIQVASRDLLRRSQLLHQTRIEGHLLIRLLHGHETTTLHADQLRSGRRRLVTTLGQQ